MSGYDVISKGKYTRPQPENIIPVQSYIFVREEGKRYLLLKLTNSRKGILTGLDLEITQLDKRGNQIGVKGVKYGQINARPGKPFVLRHKIEVDEGCVDIKVRVVAALYGAYAYSVKNGVKIEYSPAPEEGFDPKPALDKLCWESRRVSVLSLKRRVSIAVLSCILLALMLAVTAVHLIYFTREQSRFIYSGIEYAFTDNDNKADCDIVITGYKGKFSEAVIPETIEGHRVSAISPRAFANNASLKSLKIDGNIAIGKLAFSNCKNLGTVDITNVASIGDSAFKGCSSLESIEIPEGATYIAVGENAFSLCTSLNTVKINRTAALPASYSVFEGCSSLKNLELKSFNTEGGAKSIRSLFGLKRSTAFPLKTLKIGELDRISEGFCQNAALVSFSVEKLTEADISDFAFQGCPLKQFDIPVSPTAVGAYAFSGAQLATFDEAELSTVGEHAFEGSALTQFDASGISYLGDYAFASCRALGLVKFDDNSPCGEFGTGAFSDCTALVTLTVPAGISEIKGYTFKGCSALQGVSFAGTRITSLGEYCFSQCTRLTELQLPVNVSSLGDYAFGGCTSVAAAEIPEAVTQIGKGVLNGCSKLSRLTLSFGQYSDIFLGYIFGASSYGSAQSYIPSSLKSLTVSEARSIPAYAFYGCGGIESISLPEEINSIGEYAFCGCASLTDFTLPKRLSAIGASSFEGCGFTSFTVPDSVATIGNGAFKGCERLTELTLPFVGGSAYENTYLGFLFGAPDYYYDAVPDSLDTVNITSADSIGRFAFANCSGVENISLPDTVTYIGEYAFSNCMGLSKIILPASLSVVDYTAFSGCFKLYEIWNLGHASVWAPSVIKIYGSLEEAMLREWVDGFEFMYSQYDNSRYLVGYGSAEDIVLPSYKSYAVSAYLFFGDSTVRSVVIPENVTEIREGAFSGCSKLRLVYNYGSLNITAGDYSHGGVASNAFYVANSGDEAGYADINGVWFVYCNRGWTAVWNGTATNIVLDAFDYNGKRVDTFKVAARAFADDNAITEVEIGSAVKELGESAFIGCSSLKTLVISGGIKEIPSYAFAHCTSLQAAELYSGITLIGESAFLNAYSLVSAALPGALAELGAYAFASTGLTSVVIPSYCKTVGERAFSGCGSLTDVTLSAGITGIGGYAFADCRIKELSVPASVKSIGAGAFSNNTALERAVINAEITELGDYIFNNAASLTTAVLPDTARRIGEYAFEYCYKLKSVNLPASLKEISNSAFSFCNALSEIVLPASLTRIGGNAFNSCTSLLIVRNLSSLDITERSGDHGGVAKYAVAVFRTMQDKAEFASHADYRFVALNGEWYLYSYRGGSSVLTLPEKFIAGKAEVTSYTLKNYCLTDLYVLSAVIPKSVKLIQTNAFSNSDVRIYYCGGVEEWINISKPKLTEVYFYTECVHEYGRYWAYLKNGEISTEPDVYGFEYEITEPPTCVADGKQTAVCPNCGYKTEQTLGATGVHDYNRTEAVKPTCTQDGVALYECRHCDNSYTEALPKLGHEYNSDGVCVNCGNKR